MAHLATFSNITGDSLTTTVSCVIPATATFCLMTVGMRGADGGATTLSDATLGAQAFTRDSATMRIFQTFQASEGAYILAADMPSGTLTATATRTTPTDGMSISVSFFDDVVQNAPIVSLASNSAGGDPFNTSITVTDDAVLVDTISTTTGTFTTNQTGQTQITNVGPNENLETWSSHRTVTTGSNDMGWDTTSNTNRTTHIVFGLETAGGGTPSANIDFYLAGDVTDTTALVACRAPDGGAVAIEYDTDSGFGSSTTTSTQVAGSGTDFIVKTSLTGLVADTQYYYRAVEDGVDDLLSGTMKLKTAKANGSFYSYKVGFASCANTGSTNDSFTRLAARDLQAFIHMGDMHYEDITTNDVALYRTAYKDVMASATQRSLYQGTSLLYMWDDHDYGANNSGSSSPSKVAAQTTIREYIPQSRNNGSGSVEYAKQIGRILFIMLDTRSERSGSEIIGSTQLAWLEALLTSAAADSTIKGIVVNTSVPWIATGEADTWSDAPTERTAIADRIFTEGLEDSICFIAGDAHMCAGDDGTNNTFDTSAQAGWPVYQSGSLDRTPSVKGGPYSEGTFSASTGQYSVLDIADIGTQITITNTAYSSVDAVLFTHNFIISTPILSGGQTKLLGTGLLS